MNIRWEFVCNAVQILVRHARRFRSQMFVYTVQVKAVHVILGNIMSRCLRRYPQYKQWPT